MRRPSLFDNETDAAATIAPAIVAVVELAVTMIAGSDTARWIGLAFSVTVLAIVSAHVAPRLRDMRDLAYRTRQGVGVVIRHDAQWIDSALCEEAIGVAQRALRSEASISDWGLRIVSDSIYEGSLRCSGLTGHDHWMQATWDGGRSRAQMLAIITHEASHAYLFSAGVPVERHHDIMRQVGTL